MESSFLYKTVNSRPLFRVSQFTLLAIGAAFAFACGGGGGGGGLPNSPGDAFMIMERNTVDVGNFTQLYIEANDIHEDGVLLKLHYPPSLTYSKRSAVLFPGEGNEQFIFPYTEATSGQDRFLVFFFTPNKRLGNDIRLALNLKAIKRDEKAYVELGLTNNDPNVPDTQEFRVNKPFFSAIDREDVVIRGLGGSATPKPSGTPSSSKTPTPKPGSTPSSSATPTQTPTPAATAKPS